VRDTVVVNLKREAFDVYIGRPSPLGNPFHISVARTRDKACDMYASWLRDRASSDPSFRKALYGLRGKILGCYCKPLRCHGDEIVRWLEEHP
jgi:hypothetical protein